MHLPRLLYDVYFSCFRWRERVLNNSKTDGEKSFLFLQKATAPNNTFITEQCLLFHGLWAKRRTELCVHVLLEQFETRIAKNRRRKRVRSRKAAPSGWREI